MEIRKDDLSIIIPHYGNPAPALELVDAIKQQQGQGSPQIIVVDDRSPEAFPETTGVTVVQRETNGGFGSAVNSGIAVATRSHILILNSDLYVEADFLESLLRSAGPLMPATISPSVVGTDGSSQYPGRRFPRLHHHFFASLTPLARFRATAAWHEAVGHDTRAGKTEVVEVDWVVGAVMLMPREPVTRIHGFDEGFFMNCEEIDLQRRLRTSGIPSYVVGSVHVTHEGGGSSNPALRHSWLTQSSFRYSRKWGHSVLLQRLVITSASAMSFLFNAGRQALGRDVSAFATFKSDLRIIWSRRGRGNQDVSSL